MKLFEPIKIGNVELKNRVIMAPMENGMAEVGTGEVTDRIIAFFEERAQHNIAMIMPGWCITRRKRITNSIIII